MREVQILSIKLWFSSVKLPLKYLSYIIDIYETHLQI